MKRNPRAGFITVIFRYISALIILLSLGAIGFVAGTYVQVRNALPDLDKMASYRPRLTTQVFSTERNPDGTESHTLLGRVYKEDREPEELRHIPVFLQQATIAIEDRPFHRHVGIDPRGMMRAFVVNIRRGRLSQGGSTITQQLVRNMWLSHERTLDRKLKEILLALELERQFSKDEILEMYLNEVFYGHGAYGVRRASKLFFNKEPNELTLAQCALLAGLPQSPVNYSPHSHPQRAKARRDQVLRAMAEEEFITVQQALEATQEQLQASLAPLQERGITTFEAPYFTHMVVRELRDMYGVEAVYEGGLQVYTTLDMRAQKIAEEELIRGVERLRKNRSIQGGLVGQGALAAVEVKTGNVIALVGGVGPYKEVEFNRAHPGGPPFGRQPGSAFKPYVWAAALEAGFGPESTFSADPISIPLGQGRYYSPKNYSPRQGGNYTLRNALAQSVNLVSVRIVRRLGIENVQRTAARIMGIPEERIRPYWSMALGASEISPLEQAIGYATFANGGMRPERNMIRRITDYRGAPIYEHKPKLVRVIRQETAISMISMLGSVISSGTGRQARIPFPAGGKTGTTNSGRDVWWVGMTPDISCAVWVGNDNNKPMPRGTGGGFCAPIWAQFMSRASQELKLNGQFPSGAGVRASQRGDTEKEEKKEEEQTRTEKVRVTVCSASGRAATPYCPQTVERSFDSGSEPGPCRVHGPGARRTPERSDRETPAATTPAAEGRSVTVCGKSGKAAGPSCAQTVERFFPEGQGPGGTCTSCGGGGGGGESRPKPDPAPAPVPPREPVPNGAAANDRPADAE